MYCLLYLIQACSANKIVSVLFSMLRVLPRLYSAVCFYVANLLGWDIQKPSKSSISLIAPLYNRTRTYGLRLIEETDSCIRVVDECSDRGNGKQLNPLNMGQELHMLLRLSSKCSKRLRLVQVSIGRLLAAAAIEGRG